MILRALLLAVPLIGLATGGPEDEVFELSIIKLNNVEYVEGKALPEWVTALDGREVRIAGFMRNGTVDGDTWFDLCNDNCGCGTSKLQHFVRVTLEEGTTVFTPGELTLVGEFSAGELEDEDGFVESIFRLTIPSLPE